MISSIPSLSCRALAPAAMSLLAALVVLPSIAQQAQTPPPATAAQTEAEREAARRQAELAAAVAQERASSNVVTLSPFEVTAASNNGYQATNTMSGTRLNSKLEDLASAITVVTKEQLLDTAAIDINDIFSNEGNTEGIYQYTDFTIDRGFTVDNVAQSPETANRVRGLGQANLASNNFARSRAIPVDTYNVDSIEISRGPNSNIFGLGEAAGTINLIRGNANLTRNTSQFSVRTDDRGSYRGTFDLNRMLFKDTLAVRLAAVHENLEFVRKPSRDRTNRMTASVSYRPFKSTTIRGSYEAYSNYASRANSTTPRDTITEWRANGSPVWDPTFSNNTGGWRLLNGSTYTAMTAAQEAAQMPRGMLNGGTGFWNRPSLYVNPDGTISRYEVARTSTTASPAGANTQLRYQQIGTALQRGGNVFGLPPTPLFQQPGVTDRSIYDWEEINFAAPNYASKKADIYQVELEQWILKGQTHQLAFQGGFLREEIDVKSRSYIGASDGAPPVIQIDINEKFLDGTANPNFLRPYFGGSEMQTFKRPETNDNLRATLAYQLDLTNQKGLLKWIGRHNLAGYGEYRQRIYAANNNGLRYRDQIVSAEAWHTAANLLNVPGYGPENRFYTRYYAGAPVGASGSVISSAPAAPVAGNGSQVFRYYNGVTGQWINEPVEIDEVYFALGKEKNQIRTRGIVWQSFLFNDRVVPTFGWRKDKNRTVSNVPVPLRDGRLDESALDVFTNNWIESSGPTTTKGIVVRPFSGWSGIERRANAGSRLFDAVRNLRFHYNESDSFQPAPAAYNLFAELLPDPTGSGEDYGFSFSAFDSKLYVRVNRYTTKQLSARNGSTAVIGTRPIRLDFDASGDASAFSPTGGNNGGDNFDLEDTVSGWLFQLNPTWTTSELQAATYKTMGVTQEYVDSLKGRTLSDVNNIESKGTEVEIYYNPSRFWTIKGTITQQQAVDTSISPNIQRYIEQRMPYWTTITVPTGIVPATGEPLPNAGRLWWDVGSAVVGAPTGTNVPRNFYTVNVDAPYKLAVTNSGKPRPQTREWRANLTTSYKLAGAFGDHRWLRNMSVGGTARWEDKAVVGFLAGPPDADGGVRQLDGSKPIYDKARVSADVMVNYNLKLFNNRINTRLQLNVRNVLENGRLQAVSYNPDGTAWNFRIIDPRQFILTATFDL